MRVCIFGAGGFIGSRVARCLLSHGHEVVAIVRNPAKAAARAQLGADVRVGDLRNRDDIRKALDGVAVVINAAVPFYRGRCGVSRVRRIATQFAQYVTDVLDEAKRAGDLPVIISEGTPMWGDSGDGWHDEQSAYRPLGMGRIGEFSTPYLDKLSQQGAPIIRIVAAPTYGARGWFEYDVYNLLKKGWYRTFGDGQNVMSLVSVDDVAEAYRLAVEKQPLGESFAIADDQPVRFIDFVNCVAHVMGKPPVKAMPKWIGTLLAGPVWVEELTMNHRVRNAKAKKMLGWQPAHATCEEGIREAVEEVERRSPGR